MKPLFASLLCLAGGAITGCATHPETRPDERLITEPPSSPDRAVTEPVAGASEAPAGTSAATSAAVAIPSGSAGSITRAELDRVLAGSPGAFLSKVDTEPVVRSGHFVGWRIRALFPGDARFARSPLLPGDIVTRVNDRPIERPEQFSDVWSSLGAARELRLGVIRGGKAGTLVFPIVGTP